MLLPCVSLINQLIHMSPGEELEVTILDKVKCSLVGSQ
jgi:TusA-related sulfurtransferase